MEVINQNYICPHCKQEFYTNRKKFNTHVYYCTENPDHDKIIELHRNSAKEAAAKRKYEKEGELREYTVYCHSCGKEMKVIEPEKLFPCKEKYFCSSSCSHKRDRSEKTKEKISNSLINYNTNNSNKVNRICKACGKEYYWSKHKRFIGICTNVFCSPECSNYYNAHRNEFYSEEIKQKFIETGKKSAQIQSEKRRSKNEKLFYELCKKHFNKVTHNDAQFNGWDADVLIWDYKVAVLWNGKWHYEKITEKHSVKQVQNRDEIKCKEIKAIGWDIYIIKDMGRYNPSFVNEQFELFLQYIQNIQTN